MDAKGLLEALFGDNYRPSLRWLRQVQKKIPYLKIGHPVRFDLEAVRKALSENCTVNAR